QTRRAAVAALGRKKDLRATEPLIQWLGRDDTIRYELVIALGQIADPRAVQPLIREGLGSVSDPVRAAASDSLRAIGPPAIAAFGPRAVPAMVAALSSRDAARSYWAGQALLLIGHPAVAPLTTLLAQGDPATAQQAAKLLGDFGDRSAAPALSRALQRNLG